MKVDKTILNELQEVAPGLCNIARHNVYGVPAQYFDTVSDNVIKKLNEQTIPADNKTLPFTTPTGFFDRLAETTMESIRIDAINENSDNELSHTPILMSLSKTNLYALPKEYFAQLNPVIPASNTAKFILRSINTVTRFAAAAVIIGLLAVAGYLLMNNNPPTSTTTSPAIYQAAEFNPGDVKKLTEEEISDFLTTHSLAPDEIIWNTSFSNDNDLKGNVEEISEDEIRQYLKENPEPGDATNADG